MSTLIEQLTGAPLFSPGAVPIHALDSFGVKGIFDGENYPGGDGDRYYSIQATSKTLGVVYSVKFFNDRIRLQNQSTSDFTEYLIDTTVLHQYLFFISIALDLLLYVDGGFVKNLGQGAATGANDSTVMDLVGTPRATQIPQPIITFPGTTVPESDPANPWTVADGGLGLVTNDASGGFFHLATSGTTSFIRAYSRTGFIFDPGNVYFQMDFQNNDPTATASTFRSVIVILSDHLTSKNYNLFFYADRISNQASDDQYILDTTVRHLYKLVPLPDLSCDLYVDGVNVHNFPAGSFANPYVGTTDKVTIDIKGSADLNFYSWSYAEVPPLTIFAGITIQWVSSGANIPQPPAPPAPPAALDPTPYYQNLLIIQYRNRLKALATVAAVIDALVAGDLGQLVQDGFDLESAVGLQLDALGSYRGIQRALVGLDITRQYMAAPSYNDPSKDTYKGLALYGSSPSWFFLRYQDLAQLTYELTDNEMRKLIKFRAAVQSCDMSLSAIDSILWEFFGNMVTLTDGMNMTLTYTENPANPDTLFKIASQTNSLPKPAGVTVLVA